MGTGLVNDETSGPKKVHLTMDPQPIWHIPRVFLGEKADEMILFKVCCECVSCLVPLQISRHSADDLLM